MGTYCPIRLVPSIYRRRYTSFKGFQLNNHMKRVSVVLQEILLPLAKLRRIIYNLSGDYHLLCFPSAASSR